MIEIICSSMCLGVLLANSYSFSDFVTKVYIVFLSCLGMYGIIKTINKK